MAAPDNDASRERQLRRTVAELSECAIDDIEAIWGALSHDERDQLRPLLAEAARVTPGNLTAAGFADMETSQSGKLTSDDNGPAFAQRITGLAESLPNEVLSRLIFSLDDCARDAVIDALPAERRALLVRDGHTWRITERARAALRDAASAVGAQSFDSSARRSNAPAAQRSTLNAKLRRWIGRAA
ncbi:hypothetical protein [Paraburkholderia metrosideri]|uniref:DUF222 domain-containing protein n=1 Tax=Paraburkholderia metrosideri TaxID=580937 RepID=A0ABN7I1Y3_9BURK|nr:hypothetical protein [Paraburkholderia metrosideri]CAD6549071.1 hypothetical protein LMG28140_04703 [Paraburkholderia metrosideri]